MSLVTDWKNEHYDIKIETRKKEVDLPYGQHFEKKIDKMFHDRNAEVKTERGKWMNSGNIAVEIRRFTRPSGLSTTTSDYWIHLLADGKDLKGGFIFTVPYLKKRVKEMVANGDAKIKPGGDYMASSLVLMPMHKIFTKG